MARDLGEYRGKRDFTKTGEPAGLESPDAGNRFVVHKHSATADHYDLRLQVGDVLKCWAVPKGPSLDPDDKRLAVETEDHPVDYADYEGVIPKGQYGAGPMIVWDAGTWAPMDDIETSLKKGQFKFRLVGEKLKGGWMLTRLKPRPNERQPNWLLFKEKDFAADSSIDILGKRPESVKTGRAIEDLVAEPTHIASGPLRPGSLKGAVKTDFPDRIEPQLASAVDMPPGGDGWLHEIKFDGYRTMAHVRKSGTRLITRAGLDWTRRYGDVGAAFSKLPCRDAVIDGEIVVLDEKGVSDFAKLQQTLDDGSGTLLVYFAFDLLHLNGWDLRKVPLLKRKEYLQRLLATVAGENSAIHFSDHLVGKGAEFYERAGDMGLEGVVSKRIDSVYRSGRSQSWTKAKALKSGSFPIVGYSTSKAAGGLAALGLGEWVDSGIVYRGKVGTGWDRATAASLLERLEKQRDDEAGPDGMPKEIVPVKPTLTANIHYSNRTRSGAIRHGVFRNLREAQLTATRSEQKQYVTDADLASIWVTNPTRRLFGRSGPTKLEIAVYYAGIGDYMLPHILGRPITLFRCPTGKASDCFYQRHPFAGMPDAVASFTTKNSEDENQTYLAVEGVKGYLALAQFGVVEFHSWGCLRKTLERPDRLVFDLDPGEGVFWREVVEAAVHVRGELETIGLVPFVKTSGGKGIHVTVPLVPKATWKTFHKIAGDMARTIAETAPDVFVTTMAQRARKGRIFIDIHRNARGATAAAPYTLRARPYLPVSTPIGWKDLETIDDPKDLNYSTLPELLRNTGDPWSDIDKSARPLPVS